jgi:hypothetical protein
MMKDEILKRAMFAMPLSKEAKSSGIMAGFDMEEMEDQDENADMEEMPPMARTPQNPEILMNNLRGDVRSLDARYMELAQMVGEEAAMETPPEVLAMLMGQMGAQQAGIGALPQAQGMMPPGAQMPAPDQMGAPQPAPAMPQGGIPMPEGMESAPPFSQGAEAPQGYAFGGLVRGAQFLGNKASQLGSSANAALGRMFMTPQGITQPYLENVRGPGGRFTAEQIQRGGDLLQPTFTQGIREGVTRLVEQSPSISALAQKNPRLAGLVGAGTAIGLPLIANQNAGGGGRLQPMGSSLADQIPRDSLTELQSRNIGEQTPAVTMSMDKPFTTTKPDRYTVTEGKTLADMAQPPSAASALREMAPAFPGDFGAVAEPAPAKEQGKGVTDFIKEAVKEKSKVDRIREAREEYEPLFAEILGDDKESAKINALLLLSEAGLKLAGTRKPTFAMALAEAASGLPRGFAAIAAQERELGVKGKMAALQQAIGDVDAQDKYAQALKLQMLKGDFELLKEQAKKGGQIVEDGGAGLRVVKTKDGSFVGAGLVADDPTVKSAVSSRFTLRDTDNPFVENRGPAPTTMETDKAERIKLTNTLRSLDNSLSTLDSLKGVYTSAYGPGAWFQDKVNNLWIPIAPDMLRRPNFDVADASTRISTGMNSILKNIASANDGGRVAVQEQEWVRETAKGISNPTAFFADQELAAKQFGSTEAMLRNARQQVLTQLGYEGNDYVMRTPNTGTKNDPFTIPADPAQQKVMFTFLGSTIGKLQDPRAVVHVRMPNGTVQQFNPTQLRALNQ